MRRIHVHALCLAAATLSLTAVADAATIVGAAAGSLYSTPYFDLANGNVSTYVSTLVGAVSNTSPDGSGHVFTWIIPLSMSTTGAKTPSIYYSQNNVGPTDSTYCRGHRVNSAGTIVGSSNPANINVVGNSSVTLSSVTLGANETYFVACQIGGNVQINSVSYTP
jgi:hypothetical protein